jgi:glycosyltransferase involved in cell wall biosynthesis
MSSSDSSSKNTFDAANSAMDITILITCFNEEASIIDTINDIVSAVASTAIAAEIYVVDDASSDGSIDRINSYLSEHPDLNITLVAHAINCRLVPTIFEIAKIGRGKYFWTVGGDNTVRYDIARHLLSYVGKADIVIPFVQNYVGRSLKRRIISASYAGIVRLISGCPIRYYNGSSIHLRQDVIDIERKVSGFAYSADAIIQLVDMGHSYVEVPVVYVERVHGKSSALTMRNLRDVIRFFIRLSLRRAQRVIFHWQADTGKLR